MNSTEKDIATAPKTPVAATTPAVTAATTKTASRKPATTKAAAKPVAKSKPVAKPKATATKAPAKATAKPVVAKPAKAAPISKTKPVAKAVAKPVIAKPAKVKKPKMIRDSFTIPKPEYDVLDVLKLRAAKLGNPVKKTELIRAGVKAIAALSDAAFKQALLAVPSLKTGRPAKAKKV